MHLNVLRSTLLHANKTTKNMHSILKYNIYHGKSITISTPYLNYITQIYYCILVFSGTPEKSTG